MSGSCQRVIAINVQMFSFSVRLSVISAFIFLALFPWLCETVQVTGFSYHSMWMDMLVGHDTQVSEEFDLDRKSE